MFARFASDDVGDFLCLNLIVVVSRKCRQTGISVGPVVDLHVCIESALEDAAGDQVVNPHMPANAGQVEEEYIFLFAGGGIHRGDAENAEEGKDAEDASCHYFNTTVVPTRSAPARSIAEAALTS